MNNSREDKRSQLRQERYSDRKKVDPYSHSSAFFQAEGDDIFELTHFLGQFEEDEGDFLMEEYWIDERTGYQSQEVGPTSGEYIAGALGERLDDLQDSGYSISVYNFDENGFAVTGGVSQDLPRTNLGRIAGPSAKIEHSDGGFTVRGNLDVSAEELYRRVTENSELHESRLWPRIDSALRRPL